MRAARGRVTLFGVGGWGLVAAVVGMGFVAAPVPSVSPAPVPAVVSCPHVTAPTIPPTPASPARDPSAPVMGGPRLGTTGLAVPAGVPAPPALSAMSWVLADLDTRAV